MTYLRPSISKVSMEGGGEREREEEVGEREG
jgi:hypothetical protein